MQKEKIRNSILGILAFVLLFYEIIVLKGENYYLVSMAVLLIALFGFFAHFEKERPGVMLLTMIVLGPTFWELMILPPVWFSRSMKVSKVMF